MRGNAMRAVRWLGLLLAVAALVVPVAAIAANKPAKKKVPGVPHRVYTATNDPSGNSVIIFARSADGSLTQLGAVKTGGNGIKSDPPFDFPVVDTSGSINITPDGKLLFVVNAGSNTVTSFRVTANGLKRVSVASSHGAAPVTLTSSGNLLFVANEGESACTEKPTQPQLCKDPPNIYGWHFSSTGKLTGIPSSARRLTAVTPSGKKDMVGVVAGSGFSFDGGVLAVTERGLPRKYGEIDTFLISRSGAAGPAHAYATPGVDNPFGFTAIPGHILVSNVGYVATPPGVTPAAGDLTQFPGSAADYSLSSHGVLKFVSDTPTGGRAACWIVVTKNHKTAYVSNTLSKVPPLSGKGAESALSVAGNGSMTLVQQADTGPGVPSDEGISHDGKYLYVIDPSGPLAAPPPAGMGLLSHVEIYRIGPGGSITRLTPTPNALPPMISGIGVY